MVKTKIDFIRKLREIAAKELDALPDTLAAMNPDKRAAVAVKLLSLTLDGNDIYRDDSGRDIWGSLPHSTEEATAAK